MWAKYGFPNTFFLQLGVLKFVYLPKLSTNTNILKLNFKKCVLFTHQQKAHRVLYKNVLKLTYQKNYK